MEKLQAALDKARRTRGAQTERSEPVRPSSKLAPAGVREAWAQLTEIHPDPKDLVQRRVLTSTSSAEAIHFDILRTKILLQMKREGVCRLAITSPTAKCGKTTIAANIALALARQSDVRTIVFDFDMRNPSLGTVLGHIPDTRLSDLLSGETPFSEHAVRVGANVALALASRKTLDPTRYLLSDMLSGVLNEIEETYQPTVMIFDLPPLLVSDDTRALLKHVDYAMLVTRAGHTTPAQIEVCQSEIEEQCNALGIILNQCRHAGEVEKYYDY